MDLTFKQTNNFTQLQKLIKDSQYFHGSSDQLPERLFRIGKCPTLVYVAIIWSTLSFRNFNIMRETLNQA